MEHAGLPMKIIQSDYRCTNEQARRSLLPYLMYAKQVMNVIEFDSSNQYQIGFDCTYHAFVIYIGIECKRSDKKLNRVHCIRKFIIYLQHNWNERKRVKFSHPNIIILQFSFVFVLCFEWCCVCVCALDRFLFRNCNFGASKHCIRFDGPPNFIFFSKSSQKRLFSREVACVYKCAMCIHRKKKSK